MPRTMSTIERLTRIYQRALRQEVRYVDLLGDDAPERQIEHAWALAARTNEAMRALQAAQAAEDATDHEDLLWRPMSDGECPPDCF